MKVCNTANSTNNFHHDPLIKATKRVSYHTNSTPEKMNAASGDGNDDERLAALQQQMVALQQQALQHKRNGDIEAAKQALLESKRVKVQFEQVEAERKKQATEASKQMEKVGEAAVPGEPSNDQIDEEEGPEDNLLDQQLGQEENENNSSHDSASLLDQERGTSFSLQEMIDLEMIREFAQGGLPTPTLDDYLQKIQACKKAALHHKQQGQTQQALKHLKCMKQLEVVHQALQGLLGTGGGDGDPILADDAGDTEEDKALLRELLMDETNQEEADLTVDPSSSVATRLEMNDLMQMDLSEIQDAMTIGMEVPSLEEIQTQVQQQKQLAVQCKAKGDLEGAKQALQTFKIWSQKYTQIEQVLQTQASMAAPDSDDQDVRSNSEIREEDLERLLQDDEKTTTSTPGKTKPTHSPASKRNVKSSEELRQEAIRLRDKNKIAEATQVLKQYKLALSREQEEAKQQERQERLAELAQEIQLSKVQQSQYKIWQDLVDENSGQQQQQAWWRYSDLCKKVMEVIETRGTTDVVSITRPDKSEPAPVGSLRSMPEDATGVVARAIDPTEERVELTVVDLLEMDQNKFLATAVKGLDWIQLEIHVCIQLPFSETETEKPMDIYFQSKPFQLSPFLQGADESDHWNPKGRVEVTTSSTGTSADPSTEAPKSHYLSLERGESKFAKTLVRRMDRRKITLSVQCHASEDPSLTEAKRKSWFGGKKKAVTDEVPKEALQLGKVVLETKFLLSECPCLLSDLPLLGNGKRSVGGRLRFCFRTGTSFGTSSSPTAPASHHAPPSIAELPLYSDLKFAVNPKETSSPEASTNKI